MGSQENIAPRGTNPEVPKATSITARNMQAAYLFNDRRQQRRIEAFGKINRNTLRQLGAEIKCVKR